MKDGLTPACSRRRPLNREAAAADAETLDSLNGNAMPLKRIPYAGLEPLISRHLSTGEEESAVALIRELRAARERGYLTRRELEAVCYWKSPRAIRYIQTNTSAQVRGATKRALGSRSERVRLEAL